MAFLDFLFDPGAPYREAADKYEEYYNKAKDYEEPFMKPGQEQIPILKGAQQELMNPSELLAKWMKEYNMSPMAQQDITEAKNSGLDAASSMGLMGSSAAINNIENSASNIMNKDRQSFVNDLMQKYLAGIGIGQNMFNTGANTASNLGNQTMKAGGDLGQLKYGEEAAPGELMGKIMGTIAAIAANKISMGGGGGGSFGGSGASAGGSYTG